LFDLSASSAIASTTGTTHSLDNTQANISSLSNIDEERLARKMKRCTLLGAERNQTFGMSIIMHHSKTNCPVAPFIHQILWHAAQARNERERGGMLSPFCL